MAANKIIEKINADAAREAQAILVEAQKKAALTAEKIENAAKVKAEEIRAQASADADEVGRRQVLIAELSSRKNALDSQRAVIEEAFTKAEVELTKLPEKKWKELITKIIVSAVETGSEQLVVPVDDVSKYKKSFLAELNKAVTAKGIKGKLTLSRETAPFKSGVLLKGKNSDFDGSFTTLLQDVRNQVEKEVAAMLFTEVN